MGTRHLICVVKDGKYRVAQYGQCDGYPSGQGVDILNFISNPENLAKLERGIANVYFLTKRQQEKRWVDCGAKPKAQFVSSEIGDLHKRRFPENSRDTGSDILGMVANSTDKLGLVNSLSFAGDSLFCEYAYVIDFDKRVFEVFRGFNQEPLDSSERFSLFKKSDREYYPVRFWKLFSLDALPAEDVFLSELSEPEEE